MSIRQAAPAAAHQLLTDNSEAIYLDVRTEQEFANGHPSGAINIPVVFLGGGGPPQPNPDFLAVAGKSLAKDRKLVVGCLAGGRSQHACELLEDAGYTDLTNVQGGFGGQRDGAGNVVVTGWRDSGLPVTQELGDAAYAALRAKAGR